MTHRPNRQIYLPECALQYCRPSPLFREWLQAANRMYWQKLCFAPDTPLRQARYLCCAPAFQFQPDAHLPINPDFD